MTAKAALAQHRTAKYFNFLLPLLVNKDVQNGTV